MAKRGRKARPYEDELGMIIHPLLGRNRANKTFYVIGQPNIRFGTDENKAIFRFRQWLAKQEPQKQVDLYIRDGDKPLSRVVEWGEEVDKPHGSLTVPGSEQTTDITEGTLIRLEEEQLYRVLRRMIRHTEPAELAQKLGIPELAHLSHLKPPEPSIKLDRAFELYLAKPRDRELSKQEQGDSRRWWKQFTDIVDAHTLRDIKKEHILKYSTAIRDIRTKKDFAPTYVDHRFKKIKAILAAVRVMGEDVEEVRRVLDLCHMLVSPGKVETDPHPISRQDFSKLLAASKGDKMFYAVLLLSLNCGFYATDIQDLERTHLRSNGTLVMRRTKTKILRVSCLWDRTTRAIEAYLEEKPHNSPTLFLSNIGTPLRAEKIRKRFATKRKAAGVPSHVKFADIRDAAQTIPIEAGISEQEVRYLMGHRAGQSTDNYLKRKPDLVANACKAIEEYYFGT